MQTSEKQISQIQTTETELQRPDLGIESVTSGEPILASTEDFPWVAQEGMVDTAHVTLEDGTEFQYGSLIGLSSSLAKIASDVPEQASINAEQGLFKSLPTILQNGFHPNIDSVPDALSSTPMFKVAKSGRDAPRLFFTIVPPETEGGLQTVLRVGIASHKKQGSLASLVTARGKRNYGDGGKR